jgi:hypothetical protein
MDAPLGSFTTTFYGQLFRQQFYNELTGTQSTAYGIKVRSRYHKFGEQTGGKLRLEMVGEIEV